LDEGLFARIDSTGRWCVESYHTEPPQEDDEADFRAVTMAKNMGATRWRPLPAAPAMVAEEETKP
jgi:hypothetical protein